MTLQNEELVPGNTFFYSPHPKWANYGLRPWSRLSESSTLRDFPFIFAGCFDFFHFKIAQNKNNTLILFIYCLLEKKENELSSRQTDSGPFHHLSWNNYLFLIFLTFSSVCSEPVAVEH